MDWGGIAKPAVQDQGAGLFGGLGKFVGIEWVQHSESLSKGVGTGGSPADHHTFRTSRYHDVSGAAMGLERLP